MTKSTTLNVQIDPAIKEEAESMFESLGLSLNTAINIFLHKSIEVGGFPFDIVQPHYSTNDNTGNSTRYNAQTEAAMEESRNIMDGKIQAKHYSSVEEMVADFAG